MCIFESQVEENKFWTTMKWVGRTMTHSCAWLDSFRRVTWWVNAFSLICTSCHFEPEWLSWIFATQNERKKATTQLCVWHDSLMCVSLIQTSSMTRARILACVPLCEFEALSLTLHNVALDDMATRTATNTELQHIATHKSDIATHYQYIIGTHVYDCDSMKSSPLRVSTKVFPCIYLGYILWLISGHGQSTLVLIFEWIAMLGSSSTLAQLAQTDSTELKSHRTHDYCEF